MEKSYIKNFIIHIRSGKQNESRLADFHIKTARWLNNGSSVYESNLDRARAGKIRPTILYEDLCFDCQQAVEKYLKALLIAHDVESPHTHTFCTGTMQFDKTMSHRKKRNRGIQRLDYAMRMPAPHPSSQSYPVTVLCIPGWGYADPHC